MRASKDADFWEREFSGLDLGDRRLDLRFIKTIKLLSEQPTTSINQACGNWSETKAAYRMFDNERLEPSKILEAHGESAYVRMKQEPVVLIIQDTSFLNYTEHFKTEGLGRIGFTNKKPTKQEACGLIMHTALAVSPQGTPIGILGQKIWTRDPEKPFTRYRKNKKRITVDSKESRKWLDALDRSLEMVPKGIMAVTVCDRESDFFEFIGRAETLKTRYLIRSSWNRSIRNRLGKEEYLWDHMKAAPLVGTFTVEVEGKREHKQKVMPDRVATLELRISSVELRRPPKKKVNRKECLAYFKAQVIWAYEPNPPKGVEPLNWMLLTNLPVATFNEALEKVHWYKARWHIESFHKTLKSGCNIEACRLESADRLERFITLSSLVAWRLYWLTHLHRAQPESPCTEALADHEWKALYSITKRTNRLPKKPPTMREATRWIAQLGGFLARKSDGEPGIITVWRGWQRLTTLAEQWLILHPS
jgi:hypothetical protein